MTFLELLIIAIGLSMDAFAISICTGLVMTNATFKKTLTIGLYFGISQAVMPIVGYLLASRFAEKIAIYDHWVAFVVLCFIGGKMIYNSAKEEELKETPSQEVSLAPTKMLPLAIATSIDAMAVGISFAFLQVEIIPAATSIGFVTLGLCMAGAKIGNMFGTKLKSKSELAGGIILILMGIKMLL